MMTINGRAVDVSAAGCSTEGSSGIWWMLGEAMPREAWVGMATSPRLILSGGFSPMGRKILQFMAGAAAVEVGTGLLT
jgi:hypothetical protein